MEVIKINRSLILMYYGWKIESSSTRVSLFEVLLLLTLHLTNENGVRCLEF